MKKWYRSSLILLAILLSTGCVSPDDQPAVANPERAEKILLKCEAKAQAGYEALGPSAAEAVWQTKACNTAKYVVEQYWQQQRDTQLSRNRFQQDDVFAAMHWKEFFYKRQQCGYQQQASSWFCSSYSQWQEKMQQAYQKDLQASDFDSLINRVEKFCSSKSYNEISCAIWRAALTDKKQLAYNNYLSNQQQLETDFYACQSRFSQLRQVATKNNNKQKLLNFQFYSLPCSLVLQAASRTQLAYTFY
ncbi:hypothetical protein H0A36_24830 [Endozoicomonas sp. SM1973]|uniref:Lipoprotein n=1 Tax=Spartinivicinus marinus TaxID=2994442 RepID=A0A853IFD6_9GAMM|nr:hypothetical protein [Spartinivicinus marinus]MCX4027709.1 hypothetical protein [Spartinivicinus marinus]NYZ69248.1 hypothetical protein [Spartinivicinus marinus]